MRSHAPPREPGTLDITEVRVRLNEAPDDILKAYVSITINNCLAVHNLKIIQGPRGLFVSMPARRNKSGGFSDIVHPICQNCRDHLEKVVIDEYWRSLGHPVDADAESDSGVDGDER